MKPVTLFIGSNAAKLEAINLVQSVDISEGAKITIGDGRSKSAKQRGLQWRWATDVANSGIGGRHEDTKDGVHVVSKWRFGRPLIAEFMPEHFELLITLEERFKSNPDVMYYIADKFISTEDFEVPIMAKYLTEFERYYRNKGVNLTIPDDGLLDYAEMREAS